MYARVVEMKLHVFLPVLVGITMVIDMTSNDNGEQAENTRQLFLDDITDDLDWRKPLHQVAAGLVFLAWLQWYSFLFRSLLIAGEICFIVWACVYPSKLELDTIIWNGVLIVINLAHILMFMLSFVKPKLTQKEREIYQQDFKLYFRESDFKQLMKHAEVEVVDIPQAFTKQNEEITHLYYCHIISKGSKCSASQNNKQIYSVKNADWLAIYDSYSALNSDKVVSWKQRVECEFSDNSAHIEVVKFDLQKLRQYFTKKQSVRVKNSFYAYWFHKRSQHLQEGPCPSSIIYKNARECTIDYVESFSKKKSKSKFKKGAKQGSGVSIPIKNMRYISNTKTSASPFNKNQRQHDYKSKKKTRSFSIMNNTYPRAPPFIHPENDKSYCSNEACSFCEMGSFDITTPIANETQDYLQGNEHVFTRGYANTDSKTDRRVQFT
ncbi:unnamed protein product [Moneuplotes crassus]|uniref:POPDC1-3 domain-containing protein n=1 Tax=Euplotes crassus TaxID=5936 RepID=A0AAD1X6V0_EUPCR|nr:unnamed protein product [Moneuplotes crassus]